MDTFSGLGLAVLGAAAALSMTGAGPAGWALFGALLVFASALAVRAGRRRQHRATRHNGTRPRTPLALPAPQAAPIVAKAPAHTAVQAPAPVWRAVPAVPAATASRAARRAVPVRAR